MKKLTFVVFCLAAALFLAPQGWAQCPADPATLIAGQTWAFQTRAADVAPNGMASIGSFTAAISRGRGVLTVNETVNGSSLGGVPQQLSRLTNIPGTYQVYTDCSGGQLAFNLNQQAVQWEFVFANNYTTMYLVSQSLTDNYGLTKALRGTAVLLGVPAGCPALADPSQLLSGTVWSFHAESAAFEGIGSGHVGIFRPVFVPAGADPRNTLPHGVLTATETVSFNGFPSVTRLAQESGRYVVYPDCSGGQVQINGAQPVRYEFVFADLDFTRMFLLSDTLTGIVPMPATGGIQAAVLAPVPPNYNPVNPFDILAGVATRF